MPQVINTNIASLNAQRNLNETQGAANTALERLSSGLRINSASDDAAGLAISERFTAQINGLNQAVRNANDGISLAQVTEGALGESANALQRIRELSIQSANATNSPSDRDALQAEVAELKKEINRIATETEFNGLRVLDGSYVDQEYHVGPNANQTIGISIDSARTNDMGSVVDRKSDANQTGAHSGATASGGLRNNVDSYTGVNDEAIDANLSINGTTVDPSGDYKSDIPGQDETSAYAKAAAINGSGIDGVSAYANTEKSITGTNAAGDADGNLLASFVDTDGDSSGTYTLTVNGVDVLENNNLNDGDQITLSDAEAAINQYTEDTGVRAEATTNNELILRADDGRNIEVQEDMSITDTGDGTGSVSSLNTAFQNGLEAADGASNTPAPDTYTYRGDLTLQSLDNVSIGGGGENVIGFQDTLLAVDESDSIATVDISDVEGANEAILAVDAALRKINGIRAELGAVQNRFESTIANLSSSSENLSAARSRIEDADFAKESAELSRTQTLQQAGLSVLSQANQRPQQVLQLIQG